MEDEELEQTQTGSDESSDDSLDSLLGGGEEEGTGEGEGQADQVSDTSKEEKKQRDFEKAFYKEREENKRLKAEGKSKEPPAIEEGSDEERGLALLRQVVQEAIEPHLGHLKEQSEKSVMEEFKRKEYVDVLGDRIMAEYKEIPKTGDLARDLETARKAAIGNNIGLIVQSALEVGKTEGFKNREFKRNLGTVRENPRGGGNANSDLFQRYERGDLSTKELADNQAEIDEWEQEQLGVSGVSY